jgi:hypothetical protein
MLLPFLIRNILHPVPVNMTAMRVTDAALDYKALCVFKLFLRGPDGKRLRDENALPAGEEIVRRLHGHELPVQKATTVARRGFPRRPARFPGGLHGGPCRSTAGNRVPAAFAGDPGACTRTARACTGRSIARTGAVRACT